MSGTGKSLSWTRYILQSDYNYYFIFDHEGQFSQRNRVQPAQTNSEIREAVKRGFLVFDPSRMFPGRLPEAFEWFCKYAFLMAERLPGKKLFCCDELQVLTGTDRISQPVAAVLECGRNRALDFAAATLTYNAIHNRIRGQMTETIAFRSEEDRALEKLVEKGFDPEEIRNLPKGSWVLRNTDGACHRGKYF